MPLKLTPETWAQVRYEYEYTDKPVDDICLDHGVSATTLRDRVRRWRWTPRHEPVPAEGPPPMQRITPPAPLVPAMTPIDLGPFAPAVAAPPAPAMTSAAVAAHAGEMPVAPEIPDGLPAPPAAASEEQPSDPAEIVPRLQGAVARVLPAIEATVAKLAAGPMPPREMERAARTLTALIRTLRELNELLGQQQPGGARDDSGLPDDADAARNELARRVEAFLASRSDDESLEPKA